MPCSGGCLLPGEGVPSSWGGACSWWGVPALEGVHAPRGRGAMETSPEIREMVTVADGTHPIGMHSCLVLMFM